MYDLHCHLLPGIDDGARDLAMSLEMARIAVADGITHLACTPHIYPGLFENDAKGITDHVGRLRQALNDAEIGLELAVGADIQLIPDLPQRLRAGTHPTINGSHYLLFEPPHHVAPTHFVDLLYNLRASGYTPIVTHPERLTWIEEHYDWIVEAAHEGAWMQVTAGAVTGRFGKGPQYWAERMLDEGLVHMLATDAHNLTSRPPLLDEGRDKAARLVGEAEAQRLVQDRPAAAWHDRPVDSVLPPPGLGGEAAPKKKGLFGRLFGG